MVQILDIGGGAGGGSGVSYANTVFVTKDGTDATGQRERLDLPFLTVAAGLAAALTGDQIIVGPGTFVEAALVVPNTLTGLTIKGSGIATTFLTRASGPGIDVAADGSGFTLQDLGITLGGSNANAGLRVNSAGTIPYAGLVVRNVSTYGATGGGISLNGCQNYYMEGVSTARPVVIADSIGVWHDSALGNTTVSRALPSVVDAGTGWNIFDSTTIGTSSIGDLVLDGQCQIHTLPSTWVRGNLTSTITNEGGTTGPRIILEHSAGDEAGSGNITMDTLPIALGNTQIKIRVIGLLVATWDFRSAAAAVVNMDHSKPYAGSTLNVGGGTIAVSARGVPTEALTISTTGGGAPTLDRDMVTFLGLATINGATVTAITPPFPNALYTVNATADTAAADPRCTARTAGNFTINNGVIGFMDATLVRST